ncbi:MAG: hypothetical protein DELT_01693 [Desulfovibrio sp.]
MLLRNIIGGVAILIFLSAILGFSEVIWWGAVLCGLALLGRIIK